MVELAKPPPKEAEPLAASNRQADRQRLTDKPDAREVRTKAARPSPKELFWGMLAKIVRWIPWSLYALLVLSVMLLVYYAVEAEGLRLTHPGFGMKVHKLSIPEIQRLQRYQGWNKMDLANAVAALLALATFWAWDNVLKNFLSANAHVHERWDAEKFKRVMSVLAIGVIVFDAYLFYRGTVALVWGSSEFSFGALIMTVGWAFLIVIASVISIQLQPLPTKKED